MSLPDWARRKQAHRKMNISNFEFRNLLTSFVSGLRKSKNRRKQEMLKLNEWIKINTPATVTVSGSELKELATKVGAELVEGKAKGIPYLRAGRTYLVYTEIRTPKKFLRPAEVEYSFVELVNGTLQVTWSQKIEEKEGVVKFFPLVKVQGWTSYNFSQSLLKALGLQSQVVVKIPEQIVTLPVPKWVIAWTDDQWASVDGWMVFASEAEEYLQAFIDEFRQKIADQLAPKPAQVFEPTEGCWVCGFPLSPEGHCWVNGCI